MTKEIDWKAIRLLEEPFNDALNYRSRNEKDLFNKIFLKTTDLQKCLSPSTYFLMGEKGAGKTAYAVYLENNPIQGHRAQVTTMTETQYKRFIELKKNGKLSYSDYANIWRSMLLFLAGRMLVLKSKTIFSSITGKYRAVEKEIEKWSKNALNPEIESAFEAITSMNFGGKVGKKDTVEANAERKNQQTEKTPQIRHYLLETEEALKQAISSLTLSDSHTLFIDGIDYRPEGVPYQDYIECVKGLAEAIWQLNIEFFNSIRDSKGRIKIVLLVRPDVFHALNLYNSNSRLQDNTVFLDWATNEKEYRNSRLYELSGRYFSIQNNKTYSPQASWEHYFQKDSPDDDLFKRLLKITFQKPRDILTYIKLSRELAIKDDQGDENFFSARIQSSPALSKKFSDYLLGETRNYAAFYMTQIDFQCYLKFFQFLNGKQRFSFAEFQDAFVAFASWAKGESIKAKEYLRDADSLLQFFYDANIVGYSERVVSGEIHHHWSYRERSLNDISPKIKANAELLINPGISKALDIGKTSVKLNQSLPARRAPKHGARRGHGGQRKRRV